MPITQNVAESLPDFMSTILRVLQAWQCDERVPRPWFRGHENSKWQLLPGAYRGSWRSDYESEQIRDFILAAKPMVHRDLQSAWEWYFLMQHHGIPTRLLDWTESALTGLYFALRTNQGNSEAAVWMMDPFHLNASSVSDDRILSVDDTPAQSYQPAKEEGWVPDGQFPIAIAPPEINPRITAQASAFTIHGSKAIAIEALPFWSGIAFQRLAKILIPANRVEQLLDQLYVAGVKETAVFPDLDGLGREIRRNYESSLSSAI